MHIFAAEIKNNTIMEKNRKRVEYNDAKVIVSSENPVEDGKAVNSSVLKAGNTFLLNVKSPELRVKNKKLYDSNGVTVMTRKDGSMVIHVSVKRQQPKTMKAYYRQRKESFNAALEVAMLTNQYTQQNEI